MRSLYIQLRRGWETVAPKAIALLPGTKYPAWLLLVPLVLLVLGTVGARQWLSSPPVSTVAPTSVPAAPVETLAPPPDGRKAYLGIRGKTFAQGEVQGVKVLEVFADSPAARAGLRSARGAAAGSGHIIVGVASQPVRSEEDLGQIMAQLLPGAQVQLSVTEATGKAAAMLDLTLGTAPETAANTRGAHAGGTPSSTPEEAPSASRPLRETLRGKAQMPATPGTSPSQKGAEVDTGFSGPVSRPPRRESDQQGYNTLATTPGRVTPVGWDGLLSTASLKTLWSQGTTSQPGATAVPPRRD